ncbi:uncharacterized protein [Malus domestica]|uniref:uncharacterized protein n=1 Tax=Malus domestica TaxID=3750 RepID=UPI0039757651
MEKARSLQKPRTESPIEAVCGPKCPCFFFVISTLPFNIFVRFLFFPAFCSDSFSLLLVQFFSHFFCFASSVAVCSPLSSPLLVSKWIVLWGFRFLFFWNFCLQLWKTFVLKEKLTIRSNVYCKSCCSNFPVFICSFASSLSTRFGRT